MTPSREAGAPDPSGAADFLFRLMFAQSFLRAEIAQAEALLARRAKRPFKKKPVPIGRFYYVAWQDEFDLHHNAVRAMTMMEAEAIFRRQYPTRKVLGLSLKYPRRPFLSDARLSRSGGFD
jgi:hypothetical protein